MNFFRLGAGLFTKNVAMKKYRIKSDGMSRKEFMKASTLTVGGLLLSDTTGKARNTGRQLIEADDLRFLSDLTRDVLEASRIYPGAVVSPEFGTNNTGGVLIRPGGRDSYPSFWIRDYAMSLESGLIGRDEQEHMLMLTASTQCDQTWITKNGGMVPLGAIADHIRVDDSLPIYYPGTYSYEDQGAPEWGRVPPYGDQFFFILMAWYYVTHGSHTDILQRIVHGHRLIDRLERAFHMVPADNAELVYTTEDFRGVDFGFRDTVTFTGRLCYPSILKYRAALQLAELMHLAGSEEKAGLYRSVAAAIRKNLAATFMDDRGWLLASTGISAQPDVWSTALAVYYDVLHREEAHRASQALTEAYHAGAISYKGNIRHVPTFGDFNEHTAWERSLASINTYQNGAYWGTPTGWVCAAIYRVDPGAARELAGAYINDLKERDFRKGEHFGGPFECFHPETGNLQNPVYLTSVTCPYEVFNG